MAKCHNTAQLFILREVSSLRPYETYMFQNNPGQGKVKRDGSGRKVDKFISWFPFASPPPVFEVHLKGGNSPLAEVSMGPLQQVHRCGVLSLSVDNIHRGYLSMHLVAAPRLYNLENGVNYG